MWRTPLDSTTQDTLSQPLRCCVFGCDARTASVDPNTNPTNPNVIFYALPNSLGLTHLGRERRGRLHWISEKIRQGLSTSRPKRRHKPNKNYNWAEMSCAVISQPLPAHHYAATQSDHVEFQPSSGTLHYRRRGHRVAGGGGHGEYDDDDDDDDDVNIEEVYDDDDDDEDEEIDDEDWDVKRGGAMAAEIQAP
ncbi:hypothetical protein Pcinc_026732 [Petrolisthes cinctipes]|uniref:Uncharacterized protein n=1 Tax=Petrolisthes cinctipes TaxID=88211 RepID=A0AAE1F6K8_PETCI|nr:hypothetical protein Pcinc_026732 [Petrolisthes cinctipes]